MNSSWLLFKIVRRRLAICVFIEALTVFLIALDDIRPNRPDSVLDSMSVSFMIALALSLLVRFQTRFNSLPFPGSVRQRAWLPMLAFAVIWTSGALAIFVALLCLGIGPEQFWLISFTILPRLPLYVLCVLAIYRLWRSQPHLIFVAFYLPMLAQNNESVWYQNATSTYSLWWPAVFVGIAFYIYEAPVHFAQHDRRPIWGQGLSRSFPVRDSSISGRYHHLKWIGDTVEYTFLLAIGIWFLHRLLPDRIPASLQELLSFRVLIGPLLVVFYAWVVLKTLHHNTLCSGFSPVSSFWLILIQMTVILIPLAQALGVKKGVAARCDQCYCSKFIWLPKCPHCGVSGPGTIGNKNLALTARGKTPIPTPRIQFLRKVMIPIQLFILFGVIFDIQNKAFVTHTISIAIEDPKNQQTLDKVINRIEAFVKENPRLEDWTNPTVATALPSLHIPEKFRLNVKLSNKNSIRVQAFGLRWESARELPELITEGLTTEIKAIRLTPAPDIREDQGGYYTGVFQTRGYLDNRIHWAKPRNTKREADL
jgi:hypothetical protein